MLRSGKRLLRIFVLVITCWLLLYSAYWLIQPAFSWSTQADQAAYALSKEKSNRASTPTTILANTATITPVGTSTTPTVSATTVSTPSPFLCVQINNSSCNTPLQPGQGYSYTIIPGDKFNISGQHWMPGVHGQILIFEAESNLRSSTDSHVTVRPTFTILSSCSMRNAASVSTLASSPIVTDKDGAFTVSMSSERLQSGHSYDVCASGIDPDTHQHNNARGVLLFQVIVKGSSASKSGVQGHNEISKPFGMLTVTSFVLVLLALVLFFLTRQQPSRN